MHWAAFSTWDISDFTGVRSQKAGLHKIYEDVRNYCDQAGDLQDMV